MLAALLVTVSRRLVEGEPLLDPLFLAFGAVLLVVAKLFADMTLYFTEITRLHSCSAPLNLRLVVVAPGETIREHMFFTVILVSSRPNVRSR